ncbi:MAG: arylsulfatase [Candidatus Omnitrophica bacterium]|nr:arylsulfatase [Candidatus Omnitrophota bacterium]
MAKRPNILLITTDQHRGDCLSCAGHPAVETPYLDQLAEDGVRFTNAYTSVPSCTPARAAILTGMDPWNHGRLTMTGNDPLRYPATLPGLLGKAGYQTQAVGKMHHYPQRRRYGFDHMILDEEGRRFGDFISDYDLWFDDHNEEEYGTRDHSIDWNSWMARPSHLPEQMHPTHWTASEGSHFLRHRDPTSPFFMWLSFARPHSPYDPPQAYWDLYINNPDIPEPVFGDWTEPYKRRVADVNSPWNDLPLDIVRRARVGYYGNITFIDHQIGKVLYELSKFDRETLDNTFVIFTSDHGDMMGDHYHWRKTYAYEPSAKVPFLIKYPRGWDLPRNITRDQPIELRDVMPTILDAVGIDIPDSVDGSSLLNLCRDENADWRKFINGEHTYCYDKDNGMQYLTDGREKFIWFHHTGREQFFDLTDDPKEMHNLIAYPEAQPRIDVWRERLAKMNEERGDPRGQGGRLVPQPNGALKLSPNYDRWKQAAKEEMGA